MAGYGQRPGVFRRMINWCQRNPRAAAAIAVVLIVLWVVGKAAENDDTTPAASQSSDSSRSSPVATDPPASSRAPTPTAVPVTTSAAPVLSAVPADRTGTPALTAALFLKLEMNGRAALTGYDREKFGTAWSDDNGSPLGRNGCDTRNDILSRDLTGDVLKPGTRNCVVLAGTLRDPYTARTLSFQRGSTSSAIQIDHVVSLSNAWQTGAAQWTKEARVAFANDPLNLLAVDGPTNEAKGDGDAATWLPPNKAYRCAYVARQVSVKSRYKLWTTVAEFSAMASLLTETCPDRQMSPTESTRTPVLVKPKPTPVSKAPKPKRTKVAPRTTAEPEPVGCTTTSRGTCIRGGQFCPSASEGEEGTDADGRTYICRGDDGHPHWEVP